MAFVGYQEDLPANAVITDSQSVMSRMTDPGFQQSLQKSFEDNGVVKLYNSKRDILNQAKQLIGMDIQKDEGWQPAEKVKGLGPAYERYYDRLMNTQNEADFTNLVFDIDRQRERDEVLGSIGADGLATTAGTLADPTNLIPVGAPVKLFKMGSVLNKSARVASGASVAERSQKLFGYIKPIDRDMAIRTMWGEARNQGPEGLAAVANVILNRAEKGTYGKNLTEIVTAKHQFEPWGNPKVRAQMQRLSPSSEEYQRLAQIFDAVASGKMPDITGGADMFFAPKAQAALGREAPTWGRGTPLATVGDHAFFSSDGNPVDKARKMIKSSGDQAFWGTQAAAGMEVFGQFMADPDYSTQDAMMTMGMGTMLGLGGGAMTRTVGEMRMAKFALDQGDFTDFMKAKLNSRKGFGTDPEMTSFKTAIDAIRTAGEPLGKWTGRVRDPEDELGISPKSVGAAAFRAKRDPVEVYKVGGAAKFLRYTNPILDTLSGYSNDAKRIMSNLYEHNILTNSDIKGEPLAPGGAVATRVRVQMGKLADFQKDIDDLYRAYQKEQINQKNTPLKRTEFEREIWRGTWNAPTANSAFITKGVEAFRTKIAQPFGADAANVGLFKKGIGPDYSPVIYRREKIRADMDGFKTQVRLAAIDGYNNLAMKDAKAAASLPFDPNKNKAELEKFVDSYANFWALDTDATLADMADAKSGRTKGRVNMPIQYNVLEDYMENTISDVASRYSRAMAPDIELQRTFGSLDLNNEKQMVKKEYDELISKATSDKEKESLAKEKSRILDNIEWSVKNIRNRDDYSMMTSQGMRTAIKALNAWTFSRAMGKFVINAVAETGVPMLVHGYGKTYGLMMKDFHGGFKNLKMSREQARVAGIAVDRALSDRMSALLDGVNTATDESGLERNIDRFMGGAAKLFGMPYINDTFRSMSTMWNNAMFGKEIPEIAAFGTTPASQKNIVKYANLGIGQDEARMIALEMEKHGEWIDTDFYAPNTDKWDPEIARLYNASLMKAVDNEFLIPQAADMPKVAQTAWGKPLFFLRSYTFTATNRLALAGIQRANPEMAQGVAGVLAMGMLSNALYQAASGRDQPEGMNIVFGALDRAGVLGLFWEANKLADKTVGVGLGDGDKTQSFSNPIEQVGGSNAFTVADTADFISQPSLDGAYSLMPGSNWIPLEAAKRSLMQ